ncbi:hypothetical protein FEK47_05835 [Escherichia sp. E3659]|nr:hypothetical protein FEK47_05835 [Escherichia sp. E3659]
MMMTNENAKIWRFLRVRIPPVFQILERTRKNGSNYHLHTFQHLHYRSPSLKGCCNTCYSVTTAPSGNFMQANTGQPG